MLAFFANSTATIRRNEKGATAVEYGIMVALIAVVIIVAVTLLGGNLNSMFNDVACKVQGKSYGAAVVDNPDTADVNESLAAGCR